MMPCSIQADILRLPSEILQRILTIAMIKPKSEEYHQFHGWPYPELCTENMASISLSCRRFYTLVAPLVWRDKEFILPCHDENSCVVQMATDILSKKALFQGDYFLGDYVRSLNRDLTNGPHYNLHNSKLMAQLVINLKALRIDFHPAARREEYGVKYFAESCPNLTELYLSNCRDTFDDFLSLYQYKPRLEALILTDCTIKETTLKKLASMLKLKKLLFHFILIEPSVTPRTNSLLIDVSTENLHPFHYRNVEAKKIPVPFYDFFLHKHLTQLAISDSVNCEFLQNLVGCSAHLEKLAIVLNDTDPLLVRSGIHYLTKLSHLTTLSLAYREVNPITKASTRLPCYTAAIYWDDFSKKLPSLRALYISASILFVRKNFIPNLLASSPNLSNIILHNLALVTTTIESEEAQGDGSMVRQMGVQPPDSFTLSIEDWPASQKDLYTYETAREKGFVCFDETDVVCFIKGFMEI